MTSATFDAALSSERPRVGIFLRLDVTPVLRLWLGVGDCKVGIDADDGSGETYLGFGEIIGMPVFQELINGAADRVDFTLSGISQRVSALASSESDQIKGVNLRVGFGLFDKDWQIIDQPIWLRRFIVDFLSVKRDQIDGQPSYAISIAARSFLSGRRRPGLSFWTDREQQRLRPGDLFCKNASVYSLDVVKTWPRFPTS